MRDIYSLLLKILKSSTPGLVESGTTKIRQGGDGNGLAVLSRRRRFVNRPAGRFLRVLVVLAALVVWVGAQPASGQTDDDNVRMIPLAPQVEVPSEIGAVDVEVVALGSDATEVEAGGKSSVLIASDADGTLMLAAANEDGGYLGEGPGAVELGIESTAITLVAVASGRRFGEIDPELAQAIQSHEEFGRLTRLLKALMASDKNYLDRLYSYPQAVTLIKSVAAGVASAGAEPSAEAGPGFKQLHERDVAKALAADDAAASNSETGPIAPVLKDDFYCVPGSGFSLGIIPCSPWSDRDPWHWFGEAEGVEALFPNSPGEWAIYLSGQPAIDIGLFLINTTFGEYLPAPLPEGFYEKYIRFTVEASGTPPFLAVAEDTMSGCQSWDRTCKEDGLHATANPNLVNYAMELYDDGVYRDWFYTPGNSTISDKLTNSGAAYREFRTGRKRNSSVLLSPSIDQVRFQRYRFSLAEGDEEGFDRGAVVSFMNTLHLIISIVNVFTDVSEVRNGMNSADVLNLVEPIVACSAEVVNEVRATYPDLIVDGQLVFNSDPEKEVQDLAVELLANVGSAYLAALQTPACQDLLGSAVKGGVSKALLEKATSLIDGLVGGSTRQTAKVGADLALAWVKLGYDVANDLIPVLTAYFRPAGDGVDYHLFWKDNPKEFPYIYMVSKSRPPTAQFTYTQKGGFRVELDASQTEPGDSDDLSFSWRVNDADVGRGESIVHDFRAEGRYDVELVVVDGNGLTGTFSSAVDVIPGSPPAVSSLECTPTRYDTVRMVASFSDEDGDIETVEWRSNAGSVDPDRVTSAGTTQVELRASGGTTWASVIVEDRVGNRGSRVCSVNLEYVPTATLGIDSLSAACGREEPWRACYHRTGMNQGELFEFSVSMPREPVGTWHVAWCVKDDPKGLCRGQHDWTTRIDKRFANDAPLTFPMTPPAGAETFWVVAEVRECNKSLCNWPDDFTEVEFHHIEVSVLPPAGGTDGGAGGGQAGETRVFDGIEFVWVSPGEFVMGSKPGDGDSDERPDTQVTISRGFWMGKYEVTQAQWEAVMGDKPSRFKDCGGDCPVETVRRNDAQEFIRKLNERERATGYEYRLPTEAEWEYAARAGTTGHRYGDIDLIAWYSGNSGSGTHPVGQKIPNAWGFYDILGNVNEWVGDWHARYPGGSVTDPTGPETSSYRVFRGGGWQNTALSCRSANRLRILPSYRDSNVGLRLVRAERQTVPSGGGGETRVFDGIEFVWVSPGEFVMGSKPGDGDSDERPDTQVTISRGFWMGKYEVTQAQWEAVMGDKPSRFKDCGGDCPVETVRRNDAQEFIRKLNERERATGYEYRLPTEAEWEYAARAGTTGHRYGDIDLIAWYSGNSGSGTHPVGQKIPNAWGFYDILGNVNEWVGDWHARYPGGSVTDPTGPETSSYRVFRGGGWQNTALSCRSANRLRILPSYRDSNVGLRLVRAERQTVPSGGGGETRVFDGIEFVWVSPGEFVMGSKPGDGDSDERPDTQVTISRGFWMGKYEVTQAQWEAVMGDKPSRFKDCGGDCPVETVRRNDAQEFIRKLNERERATGYEYRLPTEAEWEYAARAGTTGHRYGDIDLIAWYSGNSGSGTHPVGQKIPNAWGFYDILGNVNEWVGDWHARYPGGSVTDPTGPETSSYRVFRGGGWQNTALSCRSANRLRILPSYRDSNVGLRLVRAERQTVPSGGGGETRVFDGIEFVWVSPGEFVMGSKPGDGDSDERPDTQVTISRGFWMGKYEVTQAQWEAVMGDKPSRFKDCGGDCPVETVRRNDAQEFIRKLNERERATGYEYRLPTEAEWEYAARAGTTGHRYGDIDLIAWYSGNSGSGTHPVGQKIPNAWGFYDILGNVNEWVGDWHARYPGGSVTDPTGPETSSYRVFRGGGWQNTALSCRSANRLRISPSYRDSNVGLRLVRAER